VLKRRKLGQNMGHGNGVYEADALTLNHMLV